MEELVSHFSAQIAESSGMPVKEFSKEAVKTLEKLDCTGNIRELRNVVERMLILGGNPVSKEDIENFVKK